MWTCPNCKRSFKNTNQSHGCHNLNIESLLIKRSTHINQLYHILDKKISYKDARKEVVPPDVIFYKTKSTFLAVKLKVKWIEVEFFLDYFLDLPIVKKSLQSSKRRFVHVIPIDEVDDITEELLGWIEYSYELISQNKK